jgi:hypothetical protein
MNLTEFWRILNTYPPRSGEAILVLILKGLAGLVGSLTPVVPELATMGVVGCALCMIATADVGKWLGRAVFITVVAVTWISVWG